MAENRLPSPAPLPSPKLSARAQHSQEYVHSAVREAFSLLRIGGTDCPSGPPLAAVVRQCICREPEAFEMASLEVVCRRIMGRRASRSPAGRPMTSGDTEAAGCFQADAVAEAMWQWKARQPELRILKRRDRAFAIAHGNVSRRAYLRDASASVRFFGYCNSAAAPLALGLLVVSIAERTTLALFPETLGCAVCAGLILLCVVLGLFASTRLLTDLRDDDDGRETVGQRLLEAYFWTAGVSGLVLAALATAQLVLPSDYAHIDELAATDPADFAAKATSLDGGELRENW